jgi:hypothetical protein
MSAGAGEDKTLRRWRVTLSFAAWTLIVQGALGAIIGLLALVTTPRSGKTSQDLAPFLDGTGLEVLAGLFKQAAMIAWVSGAVSVVLLAGSVGLLARKKWGWYTVVLLHLGAIIACFVWFLPFIHTLLARIDPGRAGPESFAMTFLLALAPGVVIAFLLARPVVRQFEKSVP